MRVKAKLETMAILLPEIPKGAALRLQFRLQCWRPGLKLKGKKAISGGTRNNNADYIRQSGGQGNNGSQRGYDASGNGKNAGIAVFNAGVAGH